MTTSPKISDVYFIASSEQQRYDGLLGWIELSLCGTVRIQGVTLRRTSEGRVTVSYPIRRDQYGNEHRILRPLNDEIRQRIEEQIFECLGIKPDADQ